MEKYIFSSLSNFVIRRLHIEGDVFIYLSSSRQNIFNFLKPLAMISGYNCKLIHFFYDSVEHISGHCLLFLTT